jgi:hypothetical protein
MNATLLAGLGYTLESATALMSSSKIPAGEALYSTVTFVESDWDAHLKIYPNPARDIATISFTMKQNDYVSVRIFNLLGEVVYSRDKSYLSSGEQVIQISGENLSPGIYFVHLRIGNQGVTEKLTIFR